MKTKNLLKKAFLLLALTGGASSAWGDTAVESCGNTGTNNTAVNGTSYSLGGIYVAGKGGVQQGNMPDKGVKLRSNQTNLVFEVNAGYKITKFEFWGCGNTTTAVTIVSATVDGGSDILDGKVELPAKGASTSGDIVLDGIGAEDNITLNFEEGSSAQIVGTWKVTYEQTQVIVQEITGVTLNGSAISDDDLATLKSTGALEIDGSSFNGLGALNVTLSSGATTVSREIVDDDAVYTFSINSGADEYTITVTDVAKTYSAEGSIVYYSKNGDDASGTNTKTVTANGISMSMVADKTFQYGTGSVKLGSDTYVPLKLSTGSAVNVTFPDGKVATKVIVYGWSANGDGAINSIKETLESTGTKSLDTHEDVFYATNTSTDIYPSVYEYDLDNWESLYFNPGGSASQPFVVMDFVLVDDNAVSKTITSAGWATLYSDKALDFTGDIANLTDAYIVTGATGSTLNLTSVKGNKVAANTGILIEGSEGTVTIPVAASGTDYSATNKLVGVTTETPGVAAGIYVLMGTPKVGFYETTNAFTVGANTAYLPANFAGGAARSAYFFGGNITAVENVEAVAEAKAKEGKFIENGKLVIVKNGQKFNAAGALIY